MNKFKKLELELLSFLKIDKVNFNPKQFGDQSIIQRGLKRQRLPGDQEQTPLRHKETPDTTAEMSVGTSGVVSTN